VAGKGEQPRATKLNMVKRLWAVGFPHASCTFI